jgi:hypothetical protein
MAQRKTEEEQLGVTPDEQQQQVVAPPAPPPAAATPPEGEQPPSTVEIPVDSLPEKFRSDPSKLVESYTNLERELQQRAEREREYDEQIQGLTAQMQQLIQLQQAQPAAGGDPLEEWAAEIEAARDAGDVRRELELQTALQQWVVQNTLQGAQQQAAQTAAPQMEQQFHQQNVTTAFYVDQQFQARHPDDNWDKDDPQSMGAKVAARLEREPDWLPPHVAADPLQALEALERVYTIVKAEELVGQEQQLRAAGVPQADIDRMRKLQAGVVPGATGRPGQPSEVDQQIAEMQAALRSSSWTALRGATAPAR